MKGLEMTRTGILILLLFLSASCAPAENTNTGFDHFIRAEKGRLMDGEEEYRFISFNIPNLHIIEDQMPFDEIQSWRLPDTYELNDALETISLMGGQAARIYTITVSRPDDLPGTPKHVLGPGEFNEEAFRALDNMLAVAAKHGVRVIIPLVDNWPWMGGRAEYAGFRGKDKEDFWTDPQLRDDFKKTISHIINRTNTFTNTRYRDDKAILGWETGNELTSTPEWVADIASYIRELDPNHLIIDGIHSNVLRESSFGDPNIDVVTTHHYEQDPRLMADNITKNQAMAKGRKPYFIGEFGFISTAGIETALDAVIESGASGALAWSLRYHSRDGGFYWHSEMMGLGLYKAFHWPGFSSGNDYDEKQVMNLIRNRAFEIQGKIPAALSLPSAPLLLPVASPAAISWQGSTGASGYDLERRETSAAGWSTLANNISDANEAYRPIYTDRETIPDKSYEYRVRARNSAGISGWSNVEGPVKGIGRVIADPMMHLSDIFMNGGRLEFTRKNSRQAKEDIFRLEGWKDAFIVYYLKDIFDSFQIDCFFPEEITTPLIETSQDGTIYSRVSANAEEFFYEDEAYGYWKPVRYSFFKEGLNARYLRITWNNHMHLAHTIVGP